MSVVIPSGRGPGVPPSPNGRSTWRLMGHAVPVAPPTMRGVVRSGLKIVGRCVEFRDVPAVSWRLIWLWSSGHLEAVPDFARAGLVFRFWTPSA